MEDSASLYGLVHDFGYIRKTRIQNFITLQLWPKEVETKLEGFMMVMVIRWRIRLPYMGCGLVHDFYLKLFEKDTSCDLDFSLKGYFPPISEHLYVAIHKSFTRDDIKSIVFYMDPWKSPGPNGVHATFYQKLLQTIGDSLFDIANRFFVIGQLRLIEMIHFWF